MSLNADPKSHGLTQKSLPLLGLAQSRPIATIDDPMIDDRILSDHCIVSSQSEELARADALLTGVLHFN